ncbi:AIP3-domain-containing protein [Eremomyces bilateralis CBS 781.70]|uniref:AIP3-domain-containing protein n=1 Tax=Eremomyces bilateralis CBS 781.70 TaxID=1392243 RepID=A0A6G1FWV6_9PEZI|nr:AIP3-domain-containing protein [Eremomyces bilateralis CBS 781.70]KAF1810254.1 AIP3-domain-containing protein [Eremomyces bilateralis CBS 781.70]
MNPVTDEPGSRSSGSNRSSQQSSRRQNPQAQLSQIEKSVTHLLVATKQLLETLTDWSRRQANENSVSDVYVRLGYEFNIACRAFNAIGVETQDLGPVPDLLRGILEETLSQEASQASLDRFLPRIRDIIINLLHGLKKKQQRLRQRAGRGDLPNGTTSRVGSGGSLEAELDAQSEKPSQRPQRQGSADFTAESSEIPPRTSSSSGGTGLARYSMSGGRQKRNTSLTDATRDSSSSLSSNALQNIPVIAPYPQEDTIPTPIQPAPSPSYNSSQDFPHPPPPPPPPPKQEDALLALQRGGDLERRASRRFSSYQINKQLGLPASQNSPIPNRGRDIRDSVNAARMRNSVLHSRSKSTQPLGGGSPSRPKAISPSRISEESGEEDTGSFATLVRQPVELEDRGPVANLSSISEPELGATISSPVRELVLTPEPEPTKPPVAELPVRSKSRGETKSPIPTPSPRPYVAEESPPPGKELTLYLKYKSRVKKFVLENGYEELTIPRLQLAFIEKFAWNTHNNGVDLPAIYIEDQGARYELEDLNDVKNHSILALNVEELDEVKRSIDDGLNGLRSMVEGLKSAMEVQQASLQRVSEAQQSTARDIAGMTAAPPLAAPNQSASSLQPAIARSLSQRESTGQITEVQTLRRDLAVMRQTYSSFLSEVQASMADVRTKAASVKTVAFKAAMSDLEGERGRAYLNEGKKTVTDDSKKLVDRVDEVQDSIEDLRKDVVLRGVRPLPRQLETVAKDISQATAELKKMQDALKREKPVWTKIWEKELQVVCDERDLLTMQEELAADLEDDLEKAAQTFSLVEQATKQQNLQNAQNAQAANRTGSRQLQAVALDKAVDPRLAKDGVLGEVRALQPNHESRLEAIERAERARQRELANRSDDAFKKELGSFVDEGKLKRSGGVEEAERLRKAKDIRIRQEVWERQQARANGKVAERSGSGGAPAERGGKEREGSTTSLDVSTADTSASSPEAAYQDANEAPL